jgi:hypothetical protein
MGKKRKKNKKNKKKKNRERNEKKSGGESLSRQFHTSITSKGYLACTCM